MISTGIAVKERERWLDSPRLRFAIVLMFCFGACGSSVSEQDNFAASRMAMVADQIESRGIDDAAVLAAMRVVPRHEFVPRQYQGEAYADHPLPIGEEQTISQPYIVAYMTAALRVKKGDKVLEVGTGSGYQAAVLAAMGVKVYTIEIVAPLARRAKEVLTRLGYAVTAKVGDGYDGWAEHGPFDGIIVTAAPSMIPAPLKRQLKEGGRMVIPVGRTFQDLKVLRKAKGQLVEEQTLPVRFVPMTGKAKQ